MMICNRHHSHFNHLQWKPPPLNATENGIYHNIFSLHPKIKKAHFFSYFSAIYQSELFWFELPIFGDISRRDLCLFSNIMGLNGALNVVLTAPKNTSKKSQQQCLYLEIMTLLLKIIHRPYCETFYAVQKVVPVSKKVVPGVQMYVLGL